MDDLAKKRWPSRFTDGRAESARTGMKQLEDYRWEAWNCYRDSMCKSVFTWHVKSERFARNCPSHIRYQFDAFSAQGRLDVARAMIEGDLDWSERLLDVVYRCQLCGACDYTCGRIKEIQPGRVIQAMRAKLVSDGKAPPPEFKALMEDLKTHQNPYRQDNARRAGWLQAFAASPRAQQLEIPGDGKAENLLYVGCSPLRDRASEAMPVRAAGLLLGAGCDVGVLGARERCCGNPSLRIGDQVEFVAFARENIKLFNSLGVKKLICLCPFCYSTFRRDYPQVGEEMRFEVVHVLELLADLLEQGKLRMKKRLDLTVTYHDPCHLGRIRSDGVAGTGAFTGLYDAPRRILKAIPGVTLTEMERIKDDTLCCGGGSWMRTAYPDFAESTALERIAEAETTSAEALVTHCPHCEENLGETLAASDSTLQLVNLLDLVDRAL